jgi:hypothetical protein
MTHFGPIIAQIFIEIKLLCLYQPTRIDRTVSIEEFADSASGFIGSSVESSPVASCWVESVYL